MAIVNDGSQDDTLTGVSGEGFSRRGLHRRLRRAAALTAAPTPASTPPRPSAPTTATSAGATRRTPGRHDLGASATPAARQHLEHARPAPTRDRDPGRSDASSWAADGTHITLTGLAVRAHHRAVPHADADLPEGRRRHAQGHRRQPDRAPLEPQRRLNFDQSSGELTASDRRGRGRASPELSAPAVSVAAVPPAGVKSARPAHRCTECGYASAKWVGRCPECQAWGSLAGDRRPGRRAARGVRRPGHRAGPADRRGRAGRRPGGPHRHPRVRPGARRRPRARARSCWSPASPASASPPSCSRWRTGSPRPTARRWSSPARSRPARCGCGPSGSAPCTSGSTWPPRPSCPPSSRTSSRSNPTLLILDSVQTVRSPAVDGTDGGATQVRAVASRAHRRRQEPAG